MDQLKVLARFLDSVSLEVWIVLSNYKCHYKILSNVDLDVKNFYLGLTARAQKYYRSADLHTPIHPPPPAKRDSNVRAAKSQA